MNHELISLLACPQCGSAGLSAAGDEMLSCPSCGARYPVINGVPQMLPAGLSSALERKEEYTQRLTAATRRGQPSIRSLEMNLNASTRSTGMITTSSRWPMMGMKSGIMSNGNAAWLTVNQRRSFANLGARGSFSANR